LTKKELTVWALANCWRVIAGNPSLTKPGAPNDPIVRRVLKATVVNLEVRKPAGKWEKVAGESSARVVQGSEDEPPRGLGFEKVPSITLLMQQNRDAMLFGRMSGSQSPSRDASRAPLRALMTPVGRRQCKRVWV
jgi:hypothetical protein